MIVWLECSPFNHIRVRRFSGSFAAFVWAFFQRFQYSIWCLWHSVVHWFCNWHFEMPMLPVLDDSDTFNSMLGYFGESWDQLRSIDFGEIHFNAYEMERNYSRCFVKHRIYLSQALVAFQEMIPSSLLNSLWYSALRYNFKIKTLNNLSDIEPVGTEENSEIRYLVRYVLSMH